MYVCAPLYVSTLFELIQVFCLSLQDKQTMIVLLALNAAHCVCVNDTVISLVCHCGRVLSPTPRVISAS